MEFLGDSVVALVVNEYIYKRFPEATEGDLSKLKSIIVSSFSLSSIGKEIGIGDYILLGKGEELSGGATHDPILANTVEALLGALFLDQGLDAAKNFFIPFVRKEIKRIIKNQHKQDYKSSLQLLTQQRYKCCPVYMTIREEGPDHSKMFYVKVQIDDKEFGIGQGNSKKEAQQDAARIALNHFSDQDKETIFSKHLQF